VVALSGYENFVSRLNLDENDRPTWLGKIDFVLDVQDEPHEQVLLRLGLYIGFVLAGVLLALMDRIAGGSNSNAQNSGP
jgi:uncharacterized membrane protein YqhA